MKTLKDMKEGEKTHVVKINGDGALRRRMMDMGLIDGTAVTVRRFAPLGDPIELSVRGFELSLRKADAELVEVK
ncbi:MAG: ferrous iron transport protein A [Lentisphaeria bacterium]|nr:ferrous iron transport protein A [Lentisphaeria bacterium]